MTDTITVTREQVERAFRDWVHNEGRCNVCNTLAQSGSTNLAKSFTKALFNAAHQQTIAEETR